MIAIEARKKAAQIARRFAAGQISNFDFEDQFPDSRDPAIWAIQDSFWLKGTWQVRIETKKLMLRWVVFLYSDQEYQWPKISYPGVRPIQYGIWEKLFNMGKKQQNFLSAGDYTVWPFIDRESYKNARSNPVLLSGSQQAF